MTTHDPLYYYDLFDFSRITIIDIRLIRPFLTNPDADFSVINTGTPPWIITVVASPAGPIYTVTDSSPERRVYFEGGWSTITPPPRPGTVVETIEEVEEAEAIYMDDPDAFYNEAVEEFRNSGVSEL
jgi:hypothetical protein